MNGPEKYPSHVLQEAVEAIKSLPGVGSRSALRLALHLLGQSPDNIHRFATAIDRLADDVHYCRECSMICDGDICPICADRKRDHSLICVVESVRDVMSIEQTGQFNGVYHVLGGIISPIAGIAPSDLTIAALVDRVRALAAPEPTGSQPAGIAAERIRLRDEGAQRLSQNVVASCKSPDVCPGVKTEDDFDKRAAAAAAPEEGSDATDRGAGEAERSRMPLTGAGQRPGVKTEDDFDEIEIILALSGDVEGETTSFYIYRQLQPLGVRITTLARGLGFGDNLEYADSVTLGRSILNRQEFKA